MGFGSRLAGVGYFSLAPNRHFQNVLVLVMASPDFDFLVQNTVHCTRINRVWFNFTKFSGKHQRRSK